MRLLVATLILMVAVGAAAWLRPVRMPRWQPAVAAVGSASQAVDAPPDMAQASAFDARDPALLRPQVNEEPTPEVQSAAASRPAADPLSSTLCPERMVWVSGRFCPAPPALMGERGCPVEPLEIGVCMDAFEYPNLPGVLPAVMVRADEANQLCAAEGKRLCGESEWTFACRATRDRAACNFGQSAEIRVERLWDPASISRELALNDGRRPSFETGCVADFGVYDLLGNVQEWALSEMRAYGATLKGGRFNQPGETCERSIHVKEKWSRYPHTGLRCCRDPLVKLPEER